MPGMMSVRVFSVVLTLLLFAACFAFGAAGPAAAAPRFEDFPAGQTYTGPVHAPDISSHPDARTYRTQLHNAVKGGVNFAGDHVLATWGCGGQCLMGAVINARSGYVQFLPGTICCWLEAGEDINPIDFEIGSDLLVLTGLVNEEEPMARRSYDFSGRAFRLIDTQALASGATTGGGAQPPTQLDICYYDSRGAQHDADWCTVGGDISIANVVNLSPHCRANANAVCQLGNSGSCRPGSKKYSTYVIFPYRSGRCPSTYRAAIGAVLGLGGAPAVAPSCPAGYVLSAGQCVPDAAPVPSCPAGFVFTSGQCVRDTAAAATPGVRCESACDSAYDRCLERVGRNPNADETFYEGCSEEIDQCKAACAIQKGDCYTHADGSTVCP